MIDTGFICMNLLPVKTIFKISFWILLFCITHLSYVSLPMSDNKVQKLSYLLSIFIYSHSIHLTKCCLPIFVLSCFSHIQLCVPRWGRSPEEGNGNPLQYSCLESPMDRGAWWATVHGVPKSGRDWALTCQRSKVKRRCSYSHRHLENAFTCLTLT